MRIVSVVGARPQFVKAAVVSRAFRDHQPNVHEVLVHTGQHYDANMADVFFDQLEMRPPDYALGIGGGTHAENTGRMIAAIEELLLQEAPQWVLVYGDTDSTLAGAIAAVKLQIPVAHVEAGLRSFNRRMPEEINRLVADHVGDLLFTPTDAATRNLRAEGIAEESIRQTGDVMFDAVLFYGAKAEHTSTVLGHCGLGSKGYILVTLHRSENVDQPERLRDILAGFSDAPVPIVWPVHPRTRKRIAEMGLALPPTVRPIAPVGYLDMVMLEKHARLIATDSGGVQKEAYFHRVPCVTLREVTEWVELVDLGANVVVGTERHAIARALNAQPPEVVTHGWPFGRGEAGRCVASHFDGG